MGLTWRDLVSSLAVLAIVLAYGAYQVGTRWPLISSAWGTSTVVLALGVGCAVAAAADLHTRPLPRSGVICRRITTVTGTIALVAGLIGVFSSSGHALEILVGATVMLWVTATFWHVLTIGSEQ